MTQSDLIDKIRKKNVSEENQIAQVNFEQRYTFEEVDCSELIKKLH